MIYDSWEILTDPNPKLRKRSEDFDIKKVKSADFQKFADTFADFMLESDGVGLAAPQIGFQKRIIAVQEKDGVGVYVNPVIVKSSKGLQEGEEGCLSVPGKFGMVDRHKRIQVHAVDRHGRRVSMKLSGFPAVVWQHEIDHLNGVLFIDKAKSWTEGGKTKV